MLKRIDTPEVEYAIACIVGEVESYLDCKLNMWHTLVPARQASYLKSIASPMVSRLIESLCGPDDYVQAAPNLRIHMPGDLPTAGWHSDVLFGHSPHETNYWLTITPAYDSNSLLVLKDGLYRHTTEDHYNDYLHRFLREGGDYNWFKEMCQNDCFPINTESPGLFTFCCSRIHGSVVNATPHTRISFDIRTIPCDAPVGVKRRGSYFAPRWFKSVKPELTSPIPTIATLDYATPVYLQRQVMQAFWPYPPLTELVEFHGLTESAPTLEDAMSRGACIAYSIRQLRRMVPLKYPIGFADERMWLGVGDEAKLERLWRECQ